MTEPRFSSGTAKQMADDLRIDPSTIDGTGKGGKITIEDVRRADPMPAPAELGEAGRALWYRVRFSVPDGFELDEREQAVLAMAASQADNLAALEAVLAEEGPMARGSKNQRVVHPAMVEARLCRQAIGQLLSRLALPDDAGTSEASERGRKAANARWARRGSGGRQPGVGSLF